MRRIGRRTFLGTGLAAAAGAGPALAGDQAEEVSPTEDLMREHGLLNRILLIYDEALRRIAGGQALHPMPVHQAATIVRRFVEDYHERLEETEVFPRFEKAGMMKDLVGVLRQQHDRGRQLTAEVLAATAPSARGEPKLEGKRLVTPLRAFVRMYRPHEAREDTVLFPAFHGLVRGKDWDRLGDAFEDREHQLFGEHGFERMVDEVADIEKTLGIHDLAAFTPRT